MKKILIVCLLAAITTVASAANIAETLAGVVVFNEYCRPIPKMMQTINVLGAELDRSEIHVAMVNARRTTASHLWTVSSRHQKLARLSSPANSLADMDCETT
jgi:hypothetical protein